MAEIINFTDYRSLKVINSARQYALESGNLAAVAWLDLATSHAKAGDWESCRSQLNQAQTLLLGVRNGR